MTLTLAHGPLSTDPPKDVNYRVEGPEHRLLLEPFPRRVRALLAGDTVLDTRDGKLLHESDILPQLYVPEGDVRHDLLERTDHSTHCPFKGDTAYWSVRAGDRVAENAIWGYPEPHADAEWLRGHVAVHWDAMDSWLDEDEEAIGHLRDPYHRVDVRDSSRHVRVLAGGEVVAETHAPKLLSETGLANRYYVPPADVRRDMLEPSDRRTTCPYKGVASYWTLAAGGERFEDAGWSYPEPLEEALKARDHLCLTGEGITIEVDGAPVE